MSMGLRRVRDYLELIRFSHTLFALPFAVMGAILAAWRRPAGAPSLLEWLGVLLCMATARSAAMAFNRLVDRDFDAANPRTVGRHIPRGALSAASVAGFTAVSSAAFVASTAFFLPNLWPLRLSVPVLLWLLAYSYTKRFTSLAHFWLGASLSFAPIATWIALRGDIAWPPVLLGLAVFWWVSGFDMIYACQDADYDRNVGLQSIPAKLGVRGALKLAAICHAIMVASLIGLGRSYPLGGIYYAAVIAAALLLVYEHTLVRPDDLDRVNVAFFHVNVVVSVGLMLATIADLAF